MPTRMIREGILDSDRYWSVSVNARLLFIHMMLLADDFGCVSVSPAFLRRRCFDDSPAPDKIAKLLNELHDVDLIRLYDANRACFAFIPRFKQRLQRSTLKHPAPPVALLQDDPCAQMLFKAINNITSNPTVGEREEAVGDVLANHRREEKRREVKQTPVAKAPFALPDWIPASDWGEYEEMRKKIRKPMTDRARYLAIATLEKLKKEGHGSSAVLEQSVFNAWSGLFPLKAGSVVKPKPWEGAR